MGFNSCWNSSDSFRFLAICGDLMQSLLISLWSDMIQSLWNSFVLRFVSGIWVKFCPQNCTPQINTTSVNNVLETELWRGEPFCTCLNIFQMVLMEMDDTYDIDNILKSLKLSYVYCLVPISWFFKCFHPEYTKKYFSVNVEQPNINQSILFIVTTWWLTFAFN